MESPFLKQIFTSLHFSLAGEQIPDPPDGLQDTEISPLPPVLRLGNALPMSSLLQASPKSGPWKRKQRSGVLPYSHHVPEGDDFFLIKENADFASKSRPFPLKLSNVHTLYANATRALEEVSSAHNFLTGLSKLLSVSEDTLDKSAMTTLLQATLITLQSSMWDSSRLLFNLELLMRSDALSFSRLPVPDQERRTLRAQPFSPSSLFGQAIIHSAQRLVDSRTIKGSNSNSSARFSKPRSKKKGPRQFQDHRSHRSASVAAARSITKKYSRQDNKSFASKKKALTDFKKPALPKGRHPKNVRWGSRPSRRGSQ